MQEITDSQLVECGDLAFRKLNRMYRFSHRDVDDIRQEIYMALMRARKRYHPERGSWGAYSFRFALGAVRDYFRKTVTGTGAHWQRSRPNEEGGHGAAVWLVAHDDLLYETGVEDSHDYLDDHYLLEPLSDRERFLVLCLNAGYNETEAAKMLGVTPSRVTHMLSNLRLGKLRYLNLLHADTTRVR